MRLTGAWRIMEMELWDPEAIDLLGPGLIQFGADRGGQFRFIAVQGWMDCHHGQRDGRPASSSPGKATTTATPPAGVVGRCWTRTGRCAGASTFTLATTRASERSAPRRPGPAGQPSRQGREQEGLPGTADRSRSQSKGIRAMVVFLSGHARASSRIAQRGPAALARRASAVSRVQSSPLDEKGLAVEPEPDRASAGPRS
jgi:hypothetical protein